VRALDARVRRVRDESHRVRREIEPVELDTLYRCDRLYEVWRRFFESGTFVARNSEE